MTESSRRVRVRPEKSGRLTDAVLLGRLEAAALEALEACGSFEEFQAVDLQASRPKISVTGWNNRLAELYRQRLLRRRVERSRRIRSFLL